MNAFLLGIASSLFGLLPVAGTDQGDVRSITVGSEFAQRMEALLASTTETDYQHTTAIDEDKGIVRCDCSGLIGFILRHDYPEAYLSLSGKQAPWRLRPLAVTYYETFVNAGANAKPSGPWLQVSQMKDVVPGDIVAWRKKTVKKGSTTGHVCMIAGYPTVLENGLVRVRIIDSTRSSKRTGFGSGVKTFLVDDAGKPIGYVNGSRSVKIQIAAGRLVPITAMGNPDDADFLSKDISKALALAKAKQLPARIILQDGQPQPVPWKIIPNRINFVVEDGKVIRVVRG